jgi:antimicrobial peptide system SdpB family protein
LEHLKKIEVFIDNNYWTNWLGLSRTLLALSLFLTLIFNSDIMLFYTGIQNENFSKFDFIDLNMYSWFGNLQTTRIVSIILLIPIIIGIYPKYTCVLHWLITYSFNITSIATDGGDQVASIITLLLIPICIFDNRKWHWSIEKQNKSFIAKTISTFAHLLLTIQISIIYFFASIGKFKVEEWVNGSAIYYWLTQPLFGVTSFFRPLIDVILHNSFLTAFLNWSIIFLELAIGLCILTKNANYRSKLLIISVIFHFFILLLLGIASFSIIMISCLIILLISKNNNYGFRNNSFFSFINNIYNNLFITSKKNK